MSYGPVQVFYVQAVSGASTSTYVDFGKSFTKIAVKYATMSTGAVVTIYGAESTTATFTVVNERVNTAPVQHQSMTIATAISGGNWASFEAPSFRYVKFITDAVVVGGVSYTVVASD